MLCVGRWVFLLAESNEERGLARMLLTETKGEEREREEEPEQFFARYILTRAFENEQDAGDQPVLKIGLIGPNTAYELIHLKAGNPGDNLFMVRVASYPSKGVEDWIKTSIFSTRHEASTYIYYLKSDAMPAQIL
jgi:hypothetical protein